MERLQILVSISCLLCAFDLFRIQNAQIALPTCTEIGAFEIYDGTCKNYYLCVDNGETLTPVMLSCATTAIFNPLMGVCVPEDTATCQQTTTVPPTTPAPSCHRYGRFPIQSTNCKRYYLCYWDGAGYSMMYNMSCPNTLLFEPVSEKCVSPNTMNCTCPG